MRTFSGKQNTFCYGGAVFDYVILFCVFVYVDIQRSREENSLYQCWTTIKCTFYQIASQQRQEYIKYFSLLHFTSLVMSEMALIPLPSF